MTTNQQRLMQIRDKHSLNYKQIAEIAGVSWYTVKSWLLLPESKAYRGVSDETIEKLYNYLGRKQ